MSRRPVNLLLKDMYAIKHALQLSIQIKSNTVNLKEKEGLMRDIVHEGALVARFEDQIKNYREKYRI